MTNPLRWQMILLFLCLISVEVVRADDGFGEELVREKCIACHQGSDAEGEFDLSSLLETTPLVANLKQWRKAAKRIELGDMPPRDEEVLPQSEKDKFAKWFDETIEQFDYESIKHPGYESARRLSHIEYRHTIRDLFGADLANIDRFPQDLSGTSGFDNSSETLFLQGSLFEKYAQSAEQIVETVFKKDSQEPSKSRVMQMVRDRILAPGKNTTNRKDRAGAILKAFMFRAFRRTPTEKELSSLINLFESRFQSKSDFTDALKHSLTAVLIMPQFLMKSDSPIDSTSTQNVSQRISNFDLASRLSYFLWASMPDDGLLELAKQDKLFEQNILNEQIDRMLQNRRAKSLGYVFAAQWLGFDDVGPRRRQDPIDNPWCTESLMAAMRAESSLFFYSLVRENRPISKFVDANYTYLNEELARHYQIRGIEGNHMRRVNLKTDRRGGIFTHSSVLAATAFPDRTSPVVRGKWILETVLGTPPPEPPPNVSEISEEVLERRGLSFREKLQMHSKNPKCYSCHSEMDPLGFSLENYDNFGRWRTRAFGAKIDSMSKLPDGTAFAGPAGLKKIVAEKKIDDLTRQLTQKMMTYALGRQLEYYDEAAIREVIQKTQADDYRFQTLIKSVIQSYPFQYRQRKPSPTEQETQR